MTDPAGRARAYVLDAHPETVETVLQSADAVADQWAEDATSSRDAVADPLRAELEARGVWEDLPDVLAGAVRAAGYSLSASPVAAPPYVVATSRGPMVRATVADGRLVVLLCVFEVERDGDGGNRGGGMDRVGASGPPRYVRGPTAPADSVRVTFE